VDNLTDPEELKPLRGPPPLAEEDIDRGPGSAGLVGVAATQV
jgi:hypothetical protein